MLLPSFMVLSMLSPFSPVNVILYSRFLSGLVALPEVSVGGAPDTSGTWTSMPCCRISGDTPSGSSCSSSSCEIWRQKYYTTHSLNFVPSIPFSSCCSSSPLPSLNFPLQTLEALGQVSSPLLRTSNWTEWTNFEQISVLNDRPKQERDSKYLFSTWSVLEFTRTNMV